MTNIASISSSETNCSNVLNNGKCMPTSKVYQDSQMSVNKSTSTKSSGKMNLVGLKKFSLLCIMILFISSVSAVYKEQDAKEYTYISALSICEAEKILRRDCGGATELVEKSNIDLLSVVSNKLKYNPINMIALK